MYTNHSAMRSLRVATNHNAMRFTETILGKWKDVGRMASVNALRCEL